MYKTHKQTQHTKHLFGPGCLHRMLSSGFSPGSDTRSSQPPESPICLKRSTKHSRESSRGKKSILSLRSRRPLSAASHQPAETLAGVRAGSGPPAQPSWEPGKALMLLWQCASPSSERKDTQKKETFHFSTWKILLQHQFGGLEKSCWKRGGEEMRGCTGWSHFKHHK